MGNIHRSLNDDKIYKLTVRSMLTKGSGVQGAFVGEFWLTLNEARMMRTAIEAEYERIVLIRGESTQSRVIQDDQSNAKVRGDERIGKVQSSPKDQAYSEFHKGSGLFYIDKFIDTNWSDPRWNLGTECQGGHNCDRRVRYVHWLTPPCPNCDGGMDYGTEKSSECLGWDGEPLCNIDGKRDWQYLCEEHAKLLYLRNPYKVWEVAEHGTFMLYSLVKEAFLKRYKKDQGDKWLAK